MAPSSPQLPPRADPFRLLVDAHTPYVSRFARSIGVRGADVPDIVQLVLLALHQAIGRDLDTEAPLRGWLRTVTVRTARDHHKLARHDREQLAASGIIETADEARSPEQEVQMIDVHALVNEVLDALPPEQRMVLVMSDMEEMPMREIAADLEIPEGTGYTRLRAARHKFQAVWTERRTSAAFLPFALWEPHDLLHGARAVPPLPVQGLDEVWRRLADAIRPGLVGTGVAGGALAATAKHGAVLTIKQAVVGAAVAMLVGVGLDAAIRWAVGKSPVAAVTASQEPAPAAPAVPAVVSATTAPAASVAAAPRAAASVDVATAQGADLSEHKWMQKARDALEQGDTAKALQALAHVRSPRFARDREDLRRLVLAAQDAGP